MARKQQRKKPRPTRRKPARAAAARRAKARPPRKTAKTPAIAKPLAPRPSAKTHAHRQTSEARAPGQIVPVAPLAVPLPPAEELCRVCQLCCSGNLYRHLFITADEAKRVAADVRVTTWRKRPAICLPCPALEGGRCSIFSKRPGGCGDYVCVLNSRVGRGNVPLDEALAIVRRAHELIAALEAELPAEPGDDPFETVMQRADRRLTSPGSPLPERARQANHEARAFIHKHLLDAGL